jgi:hypothetical protein
MRNRQTSLTATFVIASLTALTFVRPSAAHVAPELRGGYYADAEKAFMGGGMLISMSPTWDFNPNVEYVFVENADYFTVNADMHKDLNQGSGPAVWLGVGAAIIAVDPNENIANDTDTDLGLNLFTGIGAKRGAARPFGQLKVTLSDESETSLAFGLRF